MQIYGSRLQSISASMGLRIWNMICCILVLQNVFDIIKNVYNGPGKTLINVKDLQFKSFKSLKIA